MTTLMRWNPSLGRWPTIWDDEDISSMLPTSNTASGLEVYETKDEIVVKANVAGVEADKVDITFEKGVLIIQAQSESTQTDEDKRFFSRMSSSYSYKVAVPGEVDHSKEPEAVVENGVITITFKKAEAAKPRKLTVKAKSK